MIHEKTIVYFTSKNNKYEVEYFYRNPSKSQAKELIILALKENKKKTRSVIIEKVK